MKPGISNPVTSFIWAAVIHNGNVQATGWANTCHLLKYSILKKMLLISHREAGDKGRCTLLVVTEVNWSCLMRYSGVYLCPGVMGRLLLRTLCSPNRKHVISVRPCVILVLSPVPSHSLFVKTWQNHYQLRQLLLGCHRVNKNMLYTSPQVRSAATTDEYWQVRYHYRCFI